MLERPELFFLVVATMFGLLFATLIPPFQTPDEYIHFYRAYETSELKVPAYHNELKGAGSYMPKSIKETEDATRGGPEQIRFNPREKYDQRLTKYALIDVPLNQDEKIFYNTVPVGPQYLPLSYAPQAAVIAMAKLFDSPIIVMIYLLRLANLAIWVAICFFAIKIFPWKKWALVLVLLIPTAVSQSISMGLDVTVYASAILFIAILFRALAERSRTITLSELAVLILTAVIMVFGKVTFIALLPMILLVRSKQLPMRGWGSKLLVALTPIFLYVIWSFITKDFNPAGEIPTSADQIRSILTNPFIFPIELMSTFFFVWGDSIAQSLIGNFGWLDTPLSAPFVIFGFIMLLAAFLSTDEKQRRPLLDRRQTLVLYALAAIYFVGVCLAMYIYTSPLEQRYITGVQGRYMIPILVMLAPVVYSSSISIRSGAFTRFVQYSSVSLLLISAIAIIFRYYIVYYPMA